MTYAERLQDPRWQEKRLRIFERDKFHCVECKRKTRQIHVHHLVYSSGKEPWDYENEDLISLCKICHKKYEEARESLLRFIGPDIEWFDMAFSRLIESGLNRKQILQRLLNWGDMYAKFAGVEK